MFLNYFFFDFLLLTNPNAAITSIKSLSLLYLFFPHASHAIRTTTIKLPIIQYHIFLVFNCDKGLNRAMEYKYCWEVSIKSAWSNYQPSSEVPRSTRHTEQIKSTPCMNVMLFSVCLKFRGFRKTDFANAICYIILFILFLYLIILTINKTIIFYNMVQGKKYELTN